MFDGLVGWLVVSKIKTKTIEWISTKLVWGWVLAQNRYFFILFRLLVSMNE